MWSCFFRYAKEPVSYRGRSEKTPDTLLSFWSISFHFNQILERDEQVDRWIERTTAKLPQAQTASVAGRGNEAKDSRPRGYPLDLARPRCGGFCFFSGLRGRVAPSRAEQMMICAPISSSNPRNLRAGVDSA